MPQQKKLPLLQMLTWRESTTPRETRETRETCTCVRANNSACGVLGATRDTRSALRYMGHGGERRAGVEEKRQPPMALPQHSHCLGRHLRITLVVPCVKYRLWSVAVTVCYETDTHAYC